jgi:hypothetical protein
MVCGRTQGSLEIQQFGDKFIFIMLIINRFPNLGGTHLTFRGGEKVYQVSSLKLQQLFVEIKRLLQSRFGGGVTHTGINKIQKASAVSGNQTRISTYRAPVSRIHWGPDRVSSSIV